MIQRIRGSTSADAAADPQHWHRGQNRYQGKDVERAERAAKAAPKTSKGYRVVRLQSAREGRSGASGDGLGLPTNRH